MNNSITRRHSTCFTVTALAAFQAGCSEEFNECVRQWSDCIEECPSPEAEQAALEQAEAEYDECIEGCPVLDPNAPEAQQLAAGACIRRCGDERTAAISAATECSDRCDEEFSECFDDILGCNDPTSSKYLLPVRVSDWAAHAAGTLSDPEHGVFVCDEHFPASSPEGAEVRSAIDQFDDEPGSAIGLYPLSQPHLDKSGLFAEPATFSSFDYVDNANDSFTHPCHPDNTTLCADTATQDGFAINTCRYGSGDWSGGGDTDFFAITANANCYDYYSDPSSSDYVSSSGALHELGHAAGMNHTPSWPVDDQKYIGTMQGNLEWLSAYDIAFLREFYPESYYGLSVNFVASSKIRIDFGGPDQVEGTFDQENPDRIYLSGDKVYDCATQQPAKFYAAWFNTGMDDQDPEQCLVHELRLENTARYLRGSIRKWHAAAMQDESQDQWAGSSDTSAAELAALPRGVPLDLVFEANIYEQWRERSRDNEVRAPITLFDDATCTPPASPARPPNPIRQVGPNQFEVARGFLVDLVAKPEKLLNGAAAAPERLGTAGLGFELYFLERDSIAFALGLREHDIIWRVEGQPVGASTLASAAQQLLTTGTLHIAIARDLAMRQLTYTLR